MRQQIHHELKHPVAPLIALNRLELEQIRKDVDGHPFAEKVREVRPDDRLWELGAEKRLETFDTHRRFVRDS
jgi:hypothetical protein